MHRLALLFALLAAPAFAEVHEVKMLNRDATGGMVYEPDYLRIEPGDTVKFIATNPTHNAAAMPEIWPADAEPFKGQINEEIEVTFDTPGFYGIKCIPHYALAMVMLIQVGDEPASTASIPDSLPAPIRARFDDIIERATP